MFLLRSPGQHSINDETNSNAKTAQAPCIRGLHSPAVPLIRPPNHPSVLNAEEKGAKQSAGQSVKTPATVEKQKQNLTFPPFV
jgi:hypothetical protein